MGVTIIYSQISKTDLKEIYNYIRRDSLFYAKREVSLIKDAINRLKSNSLIGQKFKKLDNESIRQLVFRNYLIIYEINKDTTQIQILTIHHQSRSLANNPAFSDND